MRRSTASDWTASWSRACRLRDLVLELLDVSRLEHGNLLGERSPVDLAELIGEVVEREGSGWSRVEVRVRRFGRGDRRCAALRAGHHQPGRKRLEVQSGRAAPCRVHAGARRRRGAHHRRGSRHRHLGRGFAAGLRALSPRSKRRRSTLRGDGPGAIHHARYRRAAWRPHLGREHAWPGQHVLRDAAARARRQLSARARTRPEPSVEASQRTVESLPAAATRRRAHAV